MTIPLTLAISDYDHVRDLTTGRVPVEGVDLTSLVLRDVEEIFFRFASFREFDAAELSMGTYVSGLAAGDRSLTAIPVFPSRMFRLSSIFVTAKSGIREPTDLRGKRIGLPRWSQTAAIYTRAYLTHQVGVPLQDVEWVQAGLIQPGRAELVEPRTPPGVSLTRVKDRSLDEMLLAGDLDAVFSAHPPPCFMRGDGAVTRLFDDYVAEEQSYFTETSVYPIMHVVALRTDVLEANRWIARNMFTAFGEAKRRSVARVLDTTASRIPVPWGFAYADRGRELLGELFPYGVDANRHTLTQFLSFAHEQGVTERPVQLDELFPAELHQAFRI